ncbi:hypothetical protein ACFXKD_00405 [Nocardiopsis aegyptia]|uniref:hypothetical protein n=1 Tax=Nocardiopsis aegyptia TaxID=220378 RepID=UPI00366C9B7B
MASSPVASELTGTAPWDAPSLTFGDIPVDTAAHAYDQALLGRAADIELPQDV